MNTKGSAWSGIYPPKELSEDEISVGPAGMTWLPKLDVYRLNIQSLNFSQKKRGNYPSDLVKFEDSSNVTIDEYTPQQLTRTTCASVLVHMCFYRGLQII